MLNFTVGPVQSSDIVCAMALNRFRILEQKNFQR